MSVDELLALGDRDVLELLGSELTKGDTPAFPFRREQLAQFAQEWLARRREDFCRLVCPNPHVRELCKHTSSAERRILVAHVAALLLHHVEVDATLVSVLLVRHGLQKLCASLWT